MSNCSPTSTSDWLRKSRGLHEHFYPRDWQSATIEQFMQALDAYIRWYNEKRIKISLGSLSPVEYRRSLGIVA